MDAEEVGGREVSRVSDPLTGVIPSVAEETHYKGSLRWAVTITSDGQITVPAEFVGDFFRDRLRWEGERRRTRKEAAPSEPRTVSPDAYVDQRSGLIDKQMYLRLARKQAFPSKKIGKRVVARWGDVQAALSVQDAEDDPAEPRTEEEAMRLRWGLAPRG